MLALSAMPGRFSSCSSNGPHPSPHTAPPPPHPVPDHTIGGGGGGWERQTPDHICLHALRHLGLRGLSSRQTAPRAPPRPTEAALGPQNFADCGSRFNMRWSHVHWCTVYRMSVGSLNPSPYSQIRSVNTVNPLQHNLTDPPSMQETFKATLNSVHNPAPPDPVTPGCRSECSASSIDFTPKHQSMNSFSGYRAQATRLPKATKASRRHRKAYSNAFRTRHRGCI